MQAGLLSSISILDDFTLVTLPNTGAVPMFNRSTHLFDWFNLRSSVDLQ